ncbi:hypothetical protein HNQ59_001556 [Chitinivorax tropicus]|uniref:DUF6708 domain-containing protein n=1 Tax=Chitinivorax tropicus TaxID=714531 RepID=A0A840MHZ4_9PROT|nr:DUF6708 domain-containing protein [Chitinivorax tropicus]MBB5018268.1 hypothetical protein [Chitinivorax tropicus]
MPRSHHPGLATHPGPPQPVPYRDGDAALTYGRQTVSGPHCSSGGEVRHVYPDAMELGGQRRSGAGFGIMGGIIGLLGFSGALLAAYFIFTSLTKKLIISELFFLFVFLIAVFIFLCAAVAAFRLDLFSYRDEPILFNRASRKLHIFRRRFKWTRPFSRWPVVIDSYDWDCVRGEVKGGAVLMGTVPTTRFQLYLAIADRPGSDTIIDRVPVGGPSLGKDHFQPLWEHIRQYMEADGPPLQAGDSLSRHTQFSHRMAWSADFSFLDPDYKNQVPSRFDRIFFTTLSLLAFPFTFWMGLFTWLSQLSGRDPWWPDDVLAAAGGPPLSEPAALALRPAVPPAGPAG